MCRWTIFSNELSRTSLTCRETRWNAMSDIYCQDFLRYLLPKRFCRSVSRNRWHLRHHRRTFYAFGTTFLRVYKQQQGEASSSGEFKEKTLWGWICYELVCSRKPLLFKGKTEVFGVTEKKAIAIVSRCETWNNVFTSS